MAVVITPEHPASPDATALIAELDADLEPLYPRESRHGFSVPKLIADSVAFFVIRDGRAAVGCGGIKLFGTEYGEIKRMWVRPPYRGSGFGKLIRTGGLSAYSALWPVHPTTRSAGATKSASSDTSLSNLPRPLPIQLTPFALRVHAGGV